MSSSIAKRIVDPYSSNIEVITEYSPGSNFKIFLPANSKNKFWSKEGKKFN